VGSGSCSYERPTRGTVCGKMRSMRGADAGCSVINNQSLRGLRGKSGTSVDTVGAIDTVGAVVSGTVTDFLSGRAAVGLPVGLP